MERTVGNSFKVQIFLLIYSNFSICKKLYLQQQPKVRVVRFKPTNFDEAANFKLVAIESFPKLDSHQTVDLA